MVTWSHSGPLHAGISYCMAIKVSQRSVEGEVGLPQTPLAQLLFWSIWNSICSKPNTNLRGPTRPALFTSLMVAFYNLEKCWVTNVICW